MGDYFNDSLFSDIDSLVLNGGIHPVYRSPYHRMLAKRFPYAIFYRIEGKVVIVYAVLDCRRSPALIARRLP